MGLTPGCSLGSPGKFAELLMPTPCPRLMNQISVSGAQELGFSQSSFGDSNVLPRLGTNDLDPGSFQTME